MRRDLNLTIAVAVSTYGCLVMCHGFKSPTGLEGVCTARPSSWGVPFKWALTILRANRCLQRLRPLAGDTPNQLLQWLRFPFPEIDQGIDIQEDGQLQLLWRAFQ